MIPEMVEHVGHRSRQISVTGRKVVRFLHFRVAGKHMVKQLLTQFPQQIILGGKMRVKSRPPYIRPINDFLNRNLAVAFPFQ